MYMVDTPVYAVFVRHCLSVVVSEYSHDKYPHFVSIIGVPRAYTDCRVVESVCVRVCPQQLAAV